MLTSGSIYSLPYVFTPDLVPCSVTPRLTVRQFQTDLTLWENDLLFSLPAVLGSGRAPLATMSVPRHGLVEPLTG